MLLSPTPLEVILVLLSMSLTRFNKSYDSNRHRKDVFELEAKSGLEFSLGFVVAFMETFD